VTGAALDQALAALLGEHPGASDILFSPGRPPQVEVNGELRDAAAGPLSAAQTREIAAGLLDGRPALRETLRLAGSCDTSYALAGLARFRVNVFSTGGQLAIVLRILADEPPALEALGLPPVLAEIPRLANGLVLVTGATGTGKTTTLAAIVDRINATRPVHIVTLEDPVEYVHRHRRATVSQRELGSDFPTFADGLRAALRQAPKVILIGELRDPASVEIGLKAAETGHLVLATLHTLSAGQTVNRVGGMFAAEERPLVRSRLAQVHRFIVGQRLLPKVGGGRVPAVEAMGTSLRVRELIVNGETPDRTFEQVIADAHHQGWQTFDQHIVALFAAGAITQETAETWCSDRGTVTKELDRIRNARGEDTSGLGQLEMDAPAPLPPGRR
jgi:twitching motility protein PilT